MHIFRHMFLSNYWWQRSDIWSQASYRYPISREAFFDPSDSYFLFAKERGYHRWALAHSLSCFFKLYILLIDHSRQIKVDFGFQSIEDSGDMPRKSLKFPKIVYFQPITFDWRDIISLNFVLLIDHNRQIGFNFGIRGINGSGVMPLESLKFFVILYFQPIA
jgi:hypothetical protein